MKSKYAGDMPEWRHGAVEECLRVWALGAIISLVVLILSGVAFGGVKGANEIVVPVNRLAVVPLEVDADESEYTVVGVDCDCFREYDPDPKKLRLRVIGYSNTTAWVIVSSAKGGKLQPMHRVQVTIGNGPQPGPTPPTPTPPAPTPDDPEVATLASKLKAAVVKDEWNPSKLGSVAIGLNACAELARKGGTVSQMMANCKAAMRSVLNGEELSPTVYSILSGELNAGLPRSPDATVDAVAATKLFAKLSKACERASK